MAVLACLPALAVTSTPAGSSCSTVGVEDYRVSKSNLKNHKDITSMNTSKSQRVWSIVFLCVALAATGCTQESIQALPAPATAMLPAFATATPAASQPLPSGTFGAALVSATARVKAIDLPTRYVTLERADGSEVTLYADDNVRNLPQVKVGDEVTVSSYESLAYEVKKPGTTTPGATVAEEVGRAKLGEKPAGAGA